MSNLAIAGIEHPAACRTNILTTARETDSMWLEDQLGNDSTPTA